jgi:septum formation protein
MKLVLASASPRRAAILENAGFCFERRAVEIDETPLAGESAEAYVLRLAAEKARRAAEGIEESCIVIGADTTVVLDGEMLGKPTSAEDARRMLGQLSGRLHHVLTGVAVLRLPDGALRQAVEITAVTFAPLNEREIEFYISTGEPMDKAGAYGIQERGGRFVTRVEGCYFNVVGLPLARLYRMLRELSWEQEFG